MYEGRYKKGGERRGLEALGLFVNVKVVDWVDAINRSEFRKYC